MNASKYIKPVTPIHPFYVAIGATDLFLEKLRTMGGLEVIARSQDQFEELAERGKQVMQRTRSEVHLPRGDELRHQAEETLAMSRRMAERAAHDTAQAATSSLKAVREETDHLVDDTRKAASATLRTARVEASHVREAVTRRQLPTSAVVPTRLRRRTETPAAATEEEPLVAPKSPTKSTAMTKPRPPRQAPARKRAAASKKAEQAQRENSGATEASQVTTPTPTAEDTPAAEI